MNGLSFIVEITREDIAGGCRNSPKKCPVAVALKRMFPRAYSTYVNASDDPQSGVSWSANVSTMRASLSFDFPKEVAEKLALYDRTGNMEPFSFEVAI